MSDQPQSDLSPVGSFGRCEVCGKPREADTVDGDLVLQCPDGHSAI